MEAGNEAFRRGGHAEAEADYRRAVGIASRLLLLAAAGHLCAGRAASALADARINAAQNLVRRRLFEEAYEQLLSAFRLICDWRDSEGAPQGLRAACEAELPRLLEALVGHVERTGGDPERIAAAYARAAVPHRDAG